MIARRPAGRPRDATVDTAVLATARELVASSGYGGVTMEAIARKAGVGKPTIYRRWANKAELVFDALFEETETAPIPLSGDLTNDLRSLAAVVAGDMASPAAAQALVAVMADVGTEADIAARVRDQTILPRVAELAVIIERAQDHGTARRDVDAALVLHALAGVLYYHAAVLGQPMTDDLVDSVTRLLLHGIQLPTDPTTGPALPP